MIVGDVPKASNDAKSAFVSALIVRYLDAELQWGSTHENLNHSMPPGLSKQEANEWMEKTLVALPFMLGISTAEKIILYEAFLLGWAKMGNEKVFEETLELGLDQ